MNLYSDKDNDASSSRKYNQRKNKNMVFKINTGTSTLSEIENTQQNEDERNYEESVDNRHEDMVNPTSTNDIILEGNLIYRFTNDQIELDGFWFMNIDNLKEKLSYLFMHGQEFLECNIKSTEVLNENSTDNNTNYTLKICSANIYECILINKTKIFESVLQFLSGEYAGYFMYYGKTIEDRVNLTFSLQDSLVKLNGEGTNNLGSYKVIGYMNFFKTKG